MKSAMLAGLLLFCAGCETEPPVDLHSAVSKRQSSEVAFTSVDAKWTGFGASLNGMTESIQARWDDTRDVGLEESTPGSVVSVTFMATSSGRVSRVISSDDHGTGASAFTIHACVEAIKEASPFLQWTDEMTAALGHEQKMTVTFWVP